MQNNSLAILACAIALAACQRAEEKKPAGPPAVPITVTEVRVGAMEVVETTLGSLEAVADPKIDAEVAGKVVRLLAGPGQPVRKGELLALIDEADFALQNRADEAERKRTEALLAQQERVVERQRELAQKGFISQNAADDARAQRDALREQLAAARAREELSRRNRGKARVVAPFDGIIEAQEASVGDYVRVGDPLFRLVSRHRLRARLPFPESAAARLKKGQTVVLTSPQRPGQSLRSIVSEIRPGVSETGRSIEVIVDFENRAGFLPGGTVEAAIVVANRNDVVQVPEQSVVLRPAGKVVYVIADGKARQQVVEIGTRRAGMVEIVEGLTAGATVALDGAGFLTHGASVVVKMPEKSAEPGRSSESQPPQHGATPAPTEAGTKR